MAGEAPRDGAVSPSLSGRSEPFGLDLSPSVDLAIGSDLGGVRIVGLLGEGGMGRVYEARQAAPARPVAVKVMREAIAARDQLRRFEYEAEMLARLRHPHIAQIYSAGTFMHGTAAVPYFVLELVAAARPVTHFAQERRLGVRERVALFHRACNAIAHAHQKGVIHRDLKPGNILVGGDGEPKVIDFGVAKSTAADGASASLRTQAGQLVGTLLYMSPEQLAGRVDEVDARTDVYALGLVLHELVTDRPARTMRGASPLEALRIAAETGDRAAEAVTRAAAGAGAYAARSLGIMVAKCLNAAPHERYPTAAELAAEVDRWLAGEPILARPPTWAESVARLARRHRAAAVAAATVLASLVAAMAGIGFFYVRAERQAAVARADLYAADVLLAAESRDRNNLAEAGRRLAAAKTLVDAVGTGRPVELGFLAASLDDSVAVVPGEASVLAAASSADGSRLALGGGDGSVRIVAAPGAGAAAAELAIAAHAEGVWRVAWAPDGSRVASASTDGTARVWDARSGEMTLEIDGHAARVYGVAFSDDGSTIATSGGDRAARLWDAATGESRGALVGHGGTVYCVALSGDGVTAATGEQDGTVRLWDLRSEGVERVMRAHSDRVYQVAFSPDGSALLTAGRDGRVRLWKVDAEEPYATLDHPLRVNSAVFIGDGARVATACHDGIVRVFSTQTGRQVWQLRGHDGPVWTVASPRSGAWIVSGAADRTARLWATDGGCAPEISLPAAARVAAFDLRDGTLAIGSVDASVSLCDARTCRVGGRLEIGGGVVRDVVWLGREGFIAAACDDGAVRIRDPSGTRPGRTIPCHRDRVYSVDFTADGGLMATASDDTTATVRNVGDPDAVLQTLRHPARCFCARFAPLGRLIYTACGDGVVRSWDVADGARCGEFRGHGGAVNWLAVSPDGHSLATASSDGTVGIWRTADASLVHRLAGPSRQVWSVAFSPDGGRVAAASADGAIHLWETAGGRPLPTLRGPGQALWAVAFSPDGRTLAAGGLDGIVRIHGLSAAEVFRARLAVSPSQR